MAVEHVNISDPNLHEPKGCATAPVHSSYVANGSGSGNWRVLYPHGSVSFVNIATPTAITYPSSYAKVAVTTTASGGPEEFTEATTARLTYTGTADRHCRIVANVSLDQVVGANRDIQLAIYKNGAIISASECVITTQSGLKLMQTVFADSDCVTNDYFEAYVKNTGGSGDVRIYTFNLSAFAMV